MSARIPEDGDSRLPEHIDIHPQVEQREAGLSGRHIDIERPWSPPSFMPHGTTSKAMDAELSSAEIDELIWSAGEEPRPAPERGSRRWDEYDDRVAKWESDLEEQQVRAEDELSAYAEKAERELERELGELVAYIETAERDRDRTDDDAYGL